MFNVDDLESEGTQTDEATSPVKDPSCPQLSPRESLESRHTATTSQHSKIVIKPENI